MATRRPRVKPTAILKARRAPVQSHAENPSVKEEVALTISEYESVHIEKEKELFAEQAPSSTSHDDNKSSLPIASNSPKSSVAVDETPDTLPNDIKIPTPNTNPSSNPPEPANERKPFRRMITPIVNISNRRKTQTPSIIIGKVQQENSQAASSPARSQDFSNIRSPSPAKAEQKPSSKQLTAAKQERTVGVSTDDVFESQSSIPLTVTEQFSPLVGTPIDNDECFKSPPFMSPSMQYQRRPDPSSSPFVDSYGDDYAKSPSSIGNSKIRQRIRPTPYFMVRRNSIQGQSEGEDETSRRQRHYSTSSNQSGHTPNHVALQPRNSYNPNRNYSRIRTESVCSNMSDAASVRDYGAKNKRTIRSEEFQRVANAKREFNQRMNGKTPDKTRLTMYDMIYYNPTTNPMKKPAVKSEKKDGDAASVASVKTIESRTSTIKTESSVKTENGDSNSETNMPVPQLKLGPNGEIVLDEKSLVIETTGDKEARVMLANSDVVYDDEFSGTSGFYKRHKRTKDWSPDETIKFYRSLQTIGTDFSVMLQLFPNRNRRDLKLKFKKEERHNMALVNKALLHPKQFNIEELKLQFEKEDRETEKKKVEWNELKQKLAVEKKEQLTAAKKRLPKKTISVSQRCLTDGDTIYQNEFMDLPKQKKSNRYKDQTIENMDTSPNKTPVHRDQSQCKTPLRTSQLDSPLNSPPTFATLPSPKLPSFNEVLSSKHKSYLQHQNNNTIHHSSSTETNQHIYAKHPMDCSTPDDELPPPTYSIPTPVVQQLIESTSKTVESVIPTMNVSAVASEPLFNETMLDRYISKNPNMSFKVDSEDIMNMDIIFDNVPIEEDTSIANNVVEGRETGTLTSLSQNAIYTLPNVTIANGINGCQDIADNDGTTEGDASDMNNFVIDGCHGNVLDSKTNQSIVFNPDVIEEIEITTTSEIPIPPGSIIMPNTTSFEPSSDDKTSIELDIKEETKVSTSAEIAIKSDTKIPVEDNSTPIKGLKRRKKPLPVLVSRPNKERRTDNSGNRPLPSGAAKPSTPTVIEAAENFGTHLELPLKSTIQATASPGYPDVAEPSMETIIVDNKDGESNSSYNCVTSLTKEENQCLEEPTADVQDQGAFEENQELDDEQEPAAQNDLMNSLVVVESQDPHDPDRVIHEVYVMCPRTKQLSEQPLDLPDEVVQRIRSAV